MKQAVALVLSVVSALSCSVASAAGKHEESKPRHGGVVVEVNEVEYELVARDGGLVIHVADHGKPVSTKGWSGSIATVGGERLPRSSCQRVIAPWKSKAR